MTSAAMHDEAPPTKPCSANSDLPDMTANSSGVVCAATRWSVPRFCPSASESPNSEACRLELGDASRDLTHPAGKFCPDDIPMFRQLDHGVRIEVDAISDQREIVKHDGDG